jgi:uncharacterized protein DUF6338
MNIWELDKLIVFIGFVVPGFISLKTYELLSPTALVASSKQVVDAVAFSSMNYALLSWAILLVERSQLSQNAPVLYGGFYLVILFLAPIAWASLWHCLRRTQWFQSRAPHPTELPWDFLFSQRKHYWMVVTLKSGSVVAGLFREESFASSSPADRQLYLQEQWLLDDQGGFDRPVVQTAGVIVATSEIETVELKYNGEDKETSQ